MVTVAPASPVPAVLDIDWVVATLPRLGIWYIAAELEAQPYSLSEVTPAQLIRAMLEQGRVRVQYAIIPLLLRHPEFSASVQELLASLSPERVEQLRRLYMGAVYMQQMYRWVITLYLGPKADLPDYFSREMNLPSPGEYYGEIGLRQMVSTLPPPIDWWETFLDPVRMFIRSLSLEEIYGWKTG